MCYDQEKTQAAPDASLRERIEKNFHREREAANPAGGLAGRSFSHKEILAELFSYHPPTPETLPKYSAINQAAKNFAEVVMQNCPPSRDFSRVIELIQDARMTANRSIALNGLSL
jgi:hypothetical protein